MKITILLIFSIYFSMGISNLETYLKSLKKGSYENQFINSTKTLTQIFNKGCPKSWSPDQCRRCWPTSSTCPLDWCPESLGSRCGSWYKCPKSHCQYSNSLSTSDIYLCENWGNKIFKKGDCCLFGSNSGCSGCSRGNFRVGTCPR
jgi:hypothetical protein